MKLAIEPLTAQAFEAFGDVIEMEGAKHYPINEGTAERFHDLARIDANDAGGRPGLSIFVAQPRPMPIKISMMERHPIGSQSFMPLQDSDYLVVVGISPKASDLRAFRASGRQGVSYHRNRWHHPLLVLEKDARFLVIDRIGEGENLEEARVLGEVYLSSSP
jgi:ureidoglycolate lyase